MENKMKEILDENSELHQSKLDTEKKYAALKADHEELLPKYTELINVSNHMKE